MKEYIYIYNIKQAQYYINCNLQPLEIGISDINKKVYFKFNRSATKNLFDMWCKIISK